MDNFTPISGLIGGALIGLAAALLLIANGRIAGVSGILGGVMSPVRGDVAWRVLFIVGLWFGGLIYWMTLGQLFAVEVEAAWPTLIAAGLLVGFGTRVGSGCTSGHGVCGIARVSRRSITATLTFMVTAIITVLITHHVIR